MEALYTLGKIINPYNFKIGSGMVFSAGFFTSRLDSSVTSSDSFSSRASVSSDVDQTRTSYNGRFAYHRETKPSYLEGFGRSIVANCRSLSREITRAINSGAAFVAGAALGLGLLISGTVVGSAVTAVALPIIVAGSVMLIGAAVPILAITTVMVLPALPALLPILFVAAII